MIAVFRGTTLWGLSLALATVACNPPPPAPDEPVEPVEPIEDAPDILLFTIDSLRADHLMTYGYPRDTAPWLDGIAKEGVVFDKATATSSWVVPAASSIVTGMQPVQIGMDAAPLVREETEYLPRRIPEDVVTLAEALRARGYKTWAVVAEAHLSVDRGFHQGFTHWTNVGWSEADWTEEVAHHAVDEAKVHDGPAFVWIHLFDAHDPYVRHEPWLSQWFPEHEAWTWLARVHSEGQPPLEGLLMRDLRQRTDLEEGSIGLALIENLYDTEIARVDQAMERLSERMGLEDDDVIVVTATNGEEFRDHGSLGHHLNLYEEVVRVPLVMWSPSRWTGQVTMNQRVSAAAIAPTLAELAGAELSPEVKMPSLVDTIEGRGRWRGEVAASVVTMDGTRYSSTWKGDTKLIIRETDPKGEELYDLSRDPVERVNLAGARPDQVAELRDLLFMWKANLPRFETAYGIIEPDKEVLEELRSMGYLP